MIVSYGAMRTLPRIPGMDKVLGIKSGGATLKVTPKAAIILAPKEEPKVESPPPEPEQAVIPASDPRHPQHELWKQAQQAQGATEDSGEFFKKYGLYLGIGGAVLVLGGAFLIGRR